MIQNPTYENVIWNPLLSWQLGETRAGETVVIVTCQGEDGASAVLQFPDRPYLAGVINSLTEGYEAMLVAEDEGFEAAVARIDSDPSVPDDLSSILDDEQNEDN